MVKHIFKKKKISENKRILKRKTWKNGKKTWRKMERKQL